MSSQSEHETLLDGEVQIYVRDGSAKGTYQVRFRNVQDDSTRYVRASLRTSNRSLAIERAIAMYREHHSRAFLGLKSDETTIEMLMDVALPKLDKTAKSMARAAYRTYWSKFMKGEDLSAWTTEDIDRYFKWRIETANSKEGAYWKPSEDTVSVSTLKLERNLLRKIFKLGYARQLIARIPEFPERLDTLEGTHKLPRNSRRGRFTDEQYKVVSSDFAYIRRSLNKEKYQPTKEEDETSFTSWSKRKGIGSSKLIAEKDRWVVKKSSRFSRAQYWFICVFIANTGIRPAEIVKLKHKDIQIKKSASDGLYYTVIRVDEKASKVGKYRDVIAQDRHMTFERYIEYCRELEFRFGKKPEPNDWLVPQQKNYTEKVKYLGNIVRPNLKRIDMHIETKEKNEGVETAFTAYSFRAYYITKRLENGLNIYTLAKNCGVSIQTLSSTYDYNENWAFRQQMTEHIGQWSAGESHKYQIEDFAEEWK